MLMKSSTLSCFLIALCLPLTSFGAGVYERTIRNSSETIWAIQNFSDCTELIFDVSPHQAIACADKSRHLNGPCYLPPGTITFVRYSGCPAGKLTFTPYGALANSYRTIYVKYFGTSWMSGIGMKSSDESKINDSHGNITIFPGASL
jgi:hypothetical protein